MSTIAETLESKFVLYGGESEGECASFVDPFVFSEITVESVREVLVFMASKPTLNRVFWHMVNAAPRTEEEWRSAIFIGSGGEDMQRRRKERFRMAVEIVRAAVPGVHLSREALFRRET